MAEVFLNIFGNGTAYTDALPPMVQGEVFHIHSSPDPGEELLDIRAYDSYDYPVAIQVAEDITMSWRSGWNNLYVDIYFSGSTPPPEPPFPYWLLFNNNKWWRKLK